MKHLGKDPPGRVPEFFQKHWTGTAGHGTHSHLPALFPKLLVTLSPPLLQRTAGAASSNTSSSTAKDARTPFTTQQMEQPRRPLAGPSPQALSGARWPGVERKRLRGRPRAPRVGGNWRMEMPWGRATPPVKRSSMVIRPSAGASAELRPA
ncbi:hypothetical protein Purlil1_6545 [Purpureocillium lilacinum]|uniref:Uncharacterized protein n=1 Tax=Purpureocillium lilacinum TaxID=33203 RepID=A0ABR0BZ05_PURLI|nr:hypothetical protein Purlil1_6545 [Purpureocillium lilacinum]